MVSVSIFCSVSLDWIPLHGELIYPCECVFVLPFYSPKKSSIKMRMTTVIVTWNQQESKKTIPDISAAKTHQILGSHQNANFSHWELIVQSSY